MTAGLVLLRHGETADTLGGTITGQRDVPLTACGRRQIREAAHRLAAFGIDRIVTSDLVRARDSAEIVARELGLPEPTCDARWRERHWGVRQGTPKSPGRKPDDARAPEGGESEDDLERRVAAAIDGLVPRTLVVAHAGPIRAARRQLGLEPCELAPAGFVAVGDHVTRAGTRRAVAETLTPGDFSGRVLHLGTARDLDRIDAETLVLLHPVEKTVAVEALARAASAVNLTRTLTAHLTHGRAVPRPYAVALAWPNGLPADGDEVTLALEAPPRPSHRGPILPDPPLLGHAVARTCGGKAAGLALLSELGHAVPEFHLLSFEEVADPQAVARAVAGLDPSARWAVRSSADVEDSADDPMSGSFATCLDVTRDDVPRAVAEVAAGVFGDEIEARIAAGSLASRPRMGVVIQRMVERPRLAGTVFVPAPNESRLAMLEARLGAVADGLMDGTESPDLQVRFIADGTFVDEGTPIPEREVAAAVARQALRIHAATGRGDLEFAVDTDGRVQWLQARALRSTVEIVDRNGFHPAAAAYYRLLAAAVSGANLTEPVHFRLIEFGEGRFGYTHGIRARDLAFHRAIEADPAHLDLVTAHGLRIDASLRALLADPACEPGRLWETLILHGGVQLPFSIPMRGGLMERFASWSGDDGGGSTLLERELVELTEGIADAPPVESLVTLLRTPREESATASADRALARFARAGPDADFPLVAAVHEGEWRDVPRLDAGGREEWRDRALARLARSPSPDALDCRAAEACRRNRLAGERIESIAVAVGLRRGPAAERRFRSWAGYLGMKADTNEFHALARGRAFLRFGLAGFAPGKGEVDRRFAEFLRGSR